MKVPVVKKNNLAVYLENYPPVKEEEVVYGRDVAVDGFVKGLLQHGRPGDYRFYQTTGIGKETTRKPEDLLELANHRDDIFIDVKDINSLKTGTASFEFDNWHETDAEFALAISLRERYSRKAYPVSATFHVLSYQYLLHNWFLEILLKKTYDYDTIICTSTTARTALTNIFMEVSDRLQRSHQVNLGFKGDTTVIPLGVDTDVFKPRDKKELRHTLGLPADAFIITWIGRISPVDKADLIPLLLVMRDLVRDNPGKEIKLLLGGKGEDIFNEAIDKCISDLGLNDQVIIIRPLPASKSHLYCACADVFVSPVDNIQETFGITPVEAMACGVPQVVADWNGYKDTVQHGVTGFLVPVYMAEVDKEIATGAGMYDNYNLLDHFAFAQSVAIDLEAFKEALQTLISSPSLCEEMGRNSRERALKVYDWKNIVYLHEQLWEQQREKANGQVIVPAFTEPYDMPAFYKHFNHYASERISAATGIELSFSGLQVANKQATIVLYYATITDISVPVLYSIIHYLQTVKTQPFQSLTEQLSNNGLSAEKTGRHIMWLLKYGYLKIDDSNTS